MSAKPKPLTSRFVKTSGKAAPAADSVPRVGESAIAPIPNLSSVSPPTSSLGVGKGDTKALSFRVPSDFFYEFADTAHGMRISQVELLKRAFASFKEHS